MKNASHHEQLRLKITAFLFNRRADVIREEIYQALCLYVLAQANVPLSAEQIIQEIAQLLNVDSESVTDSLKTIVYDELNSLKKDGEIEFSDDVYFLDAEVKETHQLPDDLGEERLNSTIQKEINNIALAQNPDLTKVQLKILLDFFLDLSHAVASDQIGFISKGLGVQEIEPDLTKITDNIQQYRKNSKVDEILDVDEFIRRTFIYPNELLSGYLYRLIQVNIITQLIAWDPSLAYIKDTVLRGKTIYLDTSVLFVLLQTSHPLHHFLTSLLSASQNELGVKILIHEDTLAEFIAVMEGANREFSKTHKALRDVAKVCKRDGTNPSEYIEESIFADYMENNLNHIDLGSWQRYYNAKTGKILEAFLKEFPIATSRKISYVPDERFWKIKENLARASKFQVSRGKRKEEKFSFDHDARIYHLIIEERNKSNGGNLSLGYDTYLLTLDGSLPYFLKEEGLPWTETYFVFPNQWYELAFPFLRLHSNEVAKGLAFMAFSPIFPALGELIPLELCKYIFDLGGETLSLGSIKSVIESSMEERLLDSLDPSKKDSREREKAKLRIERIIAEQALQQRKTVEKANQEIQETEHRQELLENEVNTLKKQKGNLTNELRQLQINTQNQREIKAAIEQVAATYEEKLSLQQSEFNKELSESRITTNKLLEEKEARIQRETQLEERLIEMQESIQSVQKSQKQERQYREQQDTERKNVIVNLKKTILAVLMVVGMALSLIFFLQFNIDVWIIILSIAFMGISLGIYQWLPGIYAILAYGLGMVIATGAIFVAAGSDTLAWIIPMGWEILVFSIDKIFDRKVPESTSKNDIP